MGGDQLSMASYRYGIGFSDGRITTVFESAAVLVVTAQLRSNYADRVRSVISNRFDGLKVIVASLRAWWSLWFRSCIDKKPTKIPQAVTFPEDFGQRPKTGWRNMSI